MLATRYKPIGRQSLCAEKCPEVPSIDLLQFFSRGENLLAMKFERESRLLNSRSSLCKANLGRVENRTRKACGAPLIWRQYAASIAVHIEHLEVQPSGSVLACSSSIFWLNCDFSETTVFFPIPFYAFCR